MGNRVHTWFETPQERAESQLYLHWNGGLECVAAFMVVATELGGYPGLPSAFMARVIAAATLLAATRDHLTSYVGGRPTPIEGPTRQSDNGRMQWSWTRPDIPVAEKTVMVESLSGSVLHPSHELRGFTLTWDHDGRVERLSWTEVLDRVKKDPYWAPERHILSATRRLFHPDALYPPLPEFAFSEPVAA